MLAGPDLIVSIAGLHRFFARRGMTRKKGSPEIVEGTGHAIEQDLIGRLVDIFQPAECANYFSSGG